MSRQKHNERNTIFYRYFVYVLGNTYSTCVYSSTVGAYSLLGGELRADNYTLNLLDPQLRYVCTAEKRLIHGLISISNGCGFVNKW